MLTRHELTCQRRGCGRTFTATRRDARYCSRSCRRRRATPPFPVAPAPGVVDAAALADDELNGWRRMGGYLVPPPDPTNTWHFGP
jgi:hypothetical protein